MTYIDASDLIDYLPVTISKASETTVLQEACDWAESMLHSTSGSRFNAGIMTLVPPLRSWFSRNSELVLIAKEFGPVTSVDAVQFRIPGVTNWTPVVWGADDILMPSTVDPPEPGAWMVTIYPSSTSYPNIPADDLWVRWSYHGGYDSPPDSLTMLLLRMAAWKYKVREAPLGRLSSEMFGTREIIQSLPNDVRLDLARWTRRTM